MKCHRPWNENFKCYFRTELCIGCCAVWWLCCSPKAHSRTPILATAFLAFSSKKRCFDLWQWLSDQDKEAYKCITIIAGEHDNAFDISLFRKPWEEWKCSNGEPQKSRVCSQQVSMVLCNVLAHVERWAVWDPAGFQSSHLLTVVCSCAYSMFLCQPRQRASYIPQCL